MFEHVDEPLNCQTVTVAAVPLLSNTIFTAGRDAPGVEGSSEPGGFGHRAAGYDEFTQL
jgi:hypothetical protein